MVIKEFILQGIRRFREPVRFQLNNGLNVLLGGNEKGKTTIADALFFLLSMVMDTEQNEGLRSDGAKEVRLGITFKDGPDNFRLLMDVISDAVLLSKYNQEAKKFDTVSKDRDEIREFFKRELLFKPLDRYKDLYLIDPHVIINPHTYEGIPEAPEEFTLADTSDISLGGAEDFEPTSFAGNEGIMEDTMSEEEIRSEIGKLEEELKHASETAEKQEKIEQLESELTEVHDKIKTIDSLKTALQDTEKQVNALNKFSDLPEDIETKIDEYLRFEGRIKKEIDDMERQRSQYESVSADVPPFYRDKTFIAGAGLVLLFIVAPVLLSIFVGSWGIYLSAGIFAGFATMGYSLWKDAGKRGEIKKRKESVAALEKQIKEQRNKYEIEGSVIKSIVSSMKLESPASMKEGIKRYKETLDEFAKAKSGYNTAVAGNDPDMLKNQEEKLKSDIDTAQEQIRALSVSGMDPYSITQQIESLKNRLNHIGSVQVRQKTEPVVPKKQPDVSRQPRQAPVPAFIRNITAIAGLIGEPEDRMLSLVGSAASSHFKSLTRGKFQEISIAANRIVPVTDSGREVEFNSLPGSVKEKGMFSIILSIIGLVAEKWPWPIVMDDPVMLLDDANRASVYSMVKNLSKETQVVFLTKDSNLKPFADTFISL
jgi:hypothetical protein